MVDCSCQAVAVVAMANKFGQEQRAVVSCNDWDRHSEEDHQQTGYLVFVLRIVILRNVYVINKIVLIRCRCAGAGADVK